MLDRHRFTTPEPLSEEARRILAGGRDQMIRDATAKELTLSEAVEQCQIARARWHIALATGAVAQYKQELIRRLGKLAVLLEIGEIHENNKAH